MQKLNEKLVSWASIIDPQTLDQAYTSAKMPFIFPHIALMPDAHLGRGATVGSVIPTDHAIMPAAVGVDIGCGMQAVLTQFTAEDVKKADLKALHEQISRAVPLSAGRYNNKLVATAEARIEELKALAEKAQFNPADYAKNWEMQLGSLGSGNHFIEVSLDEQDRVWLFLHSGSRGVGNKIAVWHTKKALTMCRQWQIHLPNPDLAYFPEGIPEFWAYIKQMRWAQRFAYLNREEMMDRVARQVGDAVGGQVERIEEINCHHNYTEQERHFSKTVWLSRKGAIDASEGARGLIPGSMGDASYVVTGLGNPVALNSSPHGAGRNHSRSAAKKLFTREDLNDRMKGIVWGESDAFLDEHPQAYKPIDTVMEDAKDLVNIDHVLHQILNVKGD